MKGAPRRWRLGSGSVEDILRVVEGHTGKPSRETVDTGRLIDDVVWLAGMDNGKV